jgi:hypothetical protein
VNCNLVLEKGGGARSYSQYELSVNKHQKGKKAESWWEISQSWKQGRQ